MNIIDIDIAIPEDVLEYQGGRVLIYVSIVCFNTVSISIVRFTLPSETANPSSRISFPKPAAEIRHGDLAKWRITFFSLKAATLRRCSTAGCTRTSTAVQLHLDLPLVLDSPARVH